MKQGWKNLPIGCIIEKGGSSRDFKTGDWRKQKPEFIKDNCKNCLLCYINCPDGAILIEDNEMIGIDYDYCKGCGICQKVCTANAIEMKSER
ncbi:4Fe-4S binding protein [candidate division WOR-3 bacterium]|nr:4Fe-4S binding protein [candidate division WOR-3 bacterium]